jgi:hypothetical protein
MSVEARIWAEEIEIAEEARAAAAEAEILEAVARHEAWLLTEGADHLFENRHGE